MVCLEVDDLNQARIEFITWRLRASGKLHITSVCRIKDHNGNALTPRSKWNYGAAQLVGSCGLCVMLRIQIFTLDPRLRRCARMV